MGIKIRQYDENYFEPVTGLWRRAREISLPGFQHEKGHPFERDQVFFRNHVLVKDIVWVAEIDSTLVGFIAIKDDFIDLLYVEPGCWRRGVGKSLLAHAQTLSPGHLWLYTLQINHQARTFYQKAGFVARKFGISPAPELEPDVEYHWYPEIR